MIKKKIKEGSQEGVVTSYKKVKEVWHNDTLRFVVGIFFFLFAVYLIIAFSSFILTGDADASVIESSGEAIASVNEVANSGGTKGAQIAYYCINDCFGISSYFFALFLLIMGLNFMAVYKFKLVRWFILCSLSLLWFSLFFGFVFKDFYVNSYLLLGGMYGYNLSNWMIGQIGAIGVILVLIASAICVLIFCSSKTIPRLRQFFRLIFRKPKIISSEKGESSPSGSTGKDENSLNNSDEDLVSEAKNNHETPHSEAVNQDDVNQHSVEDNEPATSFTMHAEETSEDDDIHHTHHSSDFEEADPSLATSQDSDFALHDENSFSESQKREPFHQSAKDNKAESVEPEFNIEPIVHEEICEIAQEQYNPKLDLENYKFPTLDLMKHYENNSLVINEEEQQANKNRIISTLKSFGIEISSIKAKVGPTVTLYEITPESGVRISKIRGLEDDIALSLSALGIRIIAPIPGKGTIGIEVPNSEPRIVSGESIIGSRKFQESKYQLPIALGKTITDDVFMVDLCKMPHILVAGATGQGKSVGLNTIITSLLYKKHPSELKFVLVDPKKVEFSIYSVIERHFLAKLPDEEEPIITDVTKVVQTLNSVCVEMDDRYDLLKAAHVRNVKEYNEKFTNRRLNPEKGHRFLPYIVVVIDEFGDLIMTAGKEIELPIARIAQLARAVGIHMIIATQRPTTNIITGTIKANFPARIAFRVSAMMDSRTILDRPGANQLIGRGDMLFLQGADPVRVQCAFIDTPEVEAITRYISEQQSYPTAYYLPEFKNDANVEAGGSVDQNNLDSLFEDAARLIVSSQQGSTSLIQRKFSIGYNRAGRIMDQLECANIVGSAQGSKPREVLCVDLTDLETRLSNLM